MTLDFFQKKSFILMFFGSILSTKQCAVTPKGHISGLFDDFMGNYDRNTIEISWHQIFFVSIEKNNQKSFFVFTFKLFYSFFEDDLMNFLNCL